MVASTQGAARRDDGSSSGHAGRETWKLGSVVAQRFSLCAHLGHGRYGEIYKALDRSVSDAKLRLEQYVALHVLDERFRARTPLLQKLEDAYQRPHVWSHPNIVKIRGFGAERGGYFLAMEFLEGRPLRAVLEAIRPNRFSREAAFTLLRGVGGALAYAHAHNAVHGDVRAENVFVTSDQTIKLLELLPATVPRETPFFVEDTAPNGIFRPDPRDDVYGLACLAYELLSGVHPFNATSALDALNAGVAPVPIPGLAPERWDALAHGLALRRAERTGTIAELLAGLGVDACGDGPRTRETGRAAARRSRRSSPEARAVAAPETAMRMPDAAPSLARAAAAEPAAGPEPIAALRADLRDPWDPTETVIASRDVQAYWGQARRRRERRGPRVGRSLLAITLLAVLGIAVHFNRAPLERAFRQAYAALRPAAGFVSSDAGAAGQETSRSAAATRTPRAAAPPAGRTTTERRGAAAAPTAALAAPPVHAVVEPGKAAADAQPPTRRSAGASAAAPPAPESFEFATRALTVSEGQASAAVTIQRRGGRLAPASVSWWTSDGTARAGEDYADLDRQIAAFAAGEETHTILVPIIADFAAEDRESFYVNIAVADSASAGPDPSRIEVVIVDDD